MRLAQDARFREERALHVLRFTCEDCASFDPDGACGHGFPTDEHRAARYDDPRAQIVFCKEWEAR